MKRIAAIVLAACPAACASTPEKINTAIESGVSRVFEDFPPQ